jgi:hypothetical protein
MLETKGADAKAAPPLLVVLARCGSAAGAASSITCPFKPEALR